MKKICLVPVCYNSYADTLRLLISIDEAFGVCSDVELDVVLCDNSTIAPKSDLCLQRYSYSIKYLKNNNIGYFPAFNKALAALPYEVGYYDFVIVCNVDLVIATDFFSILCSYELDCDTGVVAPGIFSERDGRDLNPKMMRRPSVFKINFMRIVCSNVALFRCYRKLVRLREFARSHSQKHTRIVNEIRTNQKIEIMYGAHGSFMIFTRNYFAKGALVAYPRFLFGEEVFVAEQLRLHGLSIKHIPGLVVLDKEHASISNEKLDFICAEHKKSYDFFYDNYF